MIRRALPVVCNQRALSPNNRPAVDWNEERDLKITLIILLIVGGLVIVGAILGGPQLQSGLASFTPKPQGTKVRLESVKKGKLIETIKAPGQIEPRTKVDISAEVAARIEELPFREGQLVHKGDVVVRLDDKQFKAELAASKARSEGEQFRLQSEQSRLAGSYNSLTYAQRQLERNQSLYDSGDLPRKDLDDSQEKVDDLKSQIEAAKYSISVIESSLASAKADIASAEESLSKTVIAAPMDGVITVLNAEVGEVVLMGTMNNPGTVIMTIADLSRMILKAEVSESDVAKVANGQAAKVRINAYLDQVFSGTVTQLALQRTDRKTDNTGYFETEVEIDLRGQRILSGLMANVDIEIASHEGLVVESQAIVDRSIEDLPESVKRDNPLVDRSKKNTTVVYRMINGKAVCTPVRRGPSDDTHSIVLEGLNEGDVVVVGPFKALEKLKNDELIQDETASPDAAPSGEKKEQDGGGVRVQVG
jgi:HlyD family secretion protein